MTFLNNLRIQLFLFLASITLITSCLSKKENPLPKDNQTERLIIINQGPLLLRENSKLSVINFSNNLITDIDNDIYLTANGIEFDAGITDYVENSSYSLLLADHMNDQLDRLEILDKKTFKVLGSISAPDIQNPTKVHIVNDSIAYVFGISERSQWMNNPEYIAIINLFTQNVIKKILFTNMLGYHNSLSNIVFTDSILYLGGQNWNKAVNTNTHELQENPNIFIDNLGKSMFIGKDYKDMIWMTTGATVYSVNPISHSIESEYYIEKSMYARFSNFVFSRNHDFIFFNYFTTLATPIPDNIKGITIKQNLSNNSIINFNPPFIKRSFNDLKLNHNESLLYGTGTHDTKQPGYLFRYQINGNLKDSIKVGINPGKIYFSNH